jgi:hypothetical protein
MSIWSVIGSRCPPSSWESRVGEVVDLLLSRGHRIIHPTDLRKEREREGLYRRH